MPSPDAPPLAWTKTPPDRPGDYEMCVNTPLGDRIDRVHVNVLLCVETPWGIVPLANLIKGRPHATWRPIPLPSEARDAQH